MDPCFTLISGWLIVEQHVLWVFPVRTDARKNARTHTHTHYIVTPPLCCHKSHSGPQCPAWQKVVNLFLSTCGYKKSLAFYSAFVTPSYRLFSYLGGEQTSDTITAVRLLHLSRGEKKYQLWILGGNRSVTCNVTTFIPLCTLVSWNVRVCVLTALWCVRNM
jgi:hypothetical protein